ncbi:Nitrilase family, member 2 [Seminavis robusta]|uniref:Nitrilase family, member 2 n=1 Tax=Seminavis robusta TaxID=568900 RepID=A0A9N8H137_9STRA|nr:Nitrilase family, member 2 [Seminavis robusta]|eukprot:Sro32_g020950.1 Nitrilase family, member 2 (287) ;mRNA; f:118598-119458
MLDYPTINNLSGYQSIRGKRRLSKSFRPGPFDVICARGKDAYEHSGNQRFRALIELHRAEYAAVSNCKYLKSKIVSKVVATVRSASPEGGFVKRGMDGVWFEVGDRAAKEKCGQSFRDRNPNLYSSSTKAKAIVRQQRRTQEYEGSAAEATIATALPLTQQSSTPPLFEYSTSSIVSDEDFSSSSDSEDEMPPSPAKQQQRVSIEIAPMMMNNVFQPQPPQTMRSESLEVFGCHKFHSTETFSPSIFEEEPALEPISDDSESSFESDFLFDEDMKRDFCEVMGVMF